MAADRNRTTLQQFYTAFNQHDIEAIAPCIADDIAVPMASRSDSATAARRT